MFTQRKCSFSYAFNGLWEKIVSMVLLGHNVITFCGAISSYILSEILLDEQFLNEPAMHRTPSGIVTALMFSGWAKISLPTIFTPSGMITSIDKPRYLINTPASITKLESTAVRTFYMLHILSQDSIFCKVDKPYQSYRY